MPPKTKKEFIEFDYHKNGVIHFCRCLLYYRKRSFSKHLNIIFFKYFYNFSIIFN